MHTRQRRSSKRQRGFTLTELMIVVTITGILAALAIPSFQRYRYRARAWQAEEFLQSISLREEAYRAEFGRYRSSNPPNMCDAVPAALTTDSCFNPTADTVTGDDQQFVHTPDWAEIGAFPDGTVYHGFVVVAGTPDTTPGAPWGMRTDFWWIAHAIADLDDDGTTGYHELTSQSRRVYSEWGRGYH